MTSLSPVVWSEGMHLAPHHFQAQGRYFEELQHFAFSALFPYAWGLVGLELDDDAIRNGSVAIVHARGVMPDGIPFDFPHDPLPEPIQVQDLFSPTAQGHRVLLAIPPYRPGAPNCSFEENGRAADARFRSGAEAVSDVVTGQDEKPVLLARKNFRLVLEVEPPGAEGEEGDEGADPGTGAGPNGVGVAQGRGMIVLPLARVIRDGAGSFLYDPAYIPPSLQLGASRGLVEALGRIVEILDARSRSLRGEGSGGGAATRDPGELVRFWFAHAVNSHLPLLRHHLANRSVHPERLFADLSVLAGALNTFSLAGDPTDLPLYDHRSPGAGFEALEREIRRHLDTVLPTHAVSLPVEHRDGHFHTARVADRRALGPDAHWFLGIRSGARREDLIEKAPRLVKICSAKHIDRLVREAYPGLDVDHLPSPPPGVTPRPGTEYFRLGRTDPCWRSIEETGAVGIYVPGSVPEPELDLVAVLEESAG